MECSWTLLLLLGILYINLSQSIGFGFVGIFILQNISYQRKHLTNLLVAKQRFHPCLQQTLVALRFCCKKVVASFVCRNSSIFFFLSLSISVSLCLWISLFFVCLSCCVSHWSCDLERWGMSFVDLGQNFFFFFFGSVLFFFFFWSSLLEMLQARTSKETSKCCK